MNSSNHVMPPESNPFAAMNSSNHVMPYTNSNRAPPVNYSDMRIDSFGPPVEATRAVMPEPNYSGGLGSLFGGMSGGIGPLTYSNDRRMPAPQEPYAGMYTGAAAQQNPQLLAQMEMAKTAEAQRAAELQRQKQQLRSQPFDPRQLIG
jgi:hypothetical protein